MIHTCIFFFSFLMLVPAMGEFPKKNIKDVAAGQSNNNESHPHPISFEYKKPFRLQKNQSAFKDPDIKITFLNVSRETYKDSQGSTYTFPVLELSLNVQDHSESIKIPVYLRTTPLPSGTMAANSGGPDQGESQNVKIVVRSFDDQFPEKVELEISKKRHWLQKNWDSIRSWFRK